MQGLFNSYLCLQLQTLQWEGLLLADPEDLIFDRYDVILFCSLSAVKPDPINQLIDNQLVLTPTKYVRQARGLQGFPKQTVYIFKCQKATETYSICFANINNIFGDVQNGLLFQEGQSPAPNAHLDEPLGLNATQVNEMQQR